jgi:hypothetical protein
VGVPLGYDLFADDAVAGRSFGLSFATIEKLSIGYEGIRVSGDNYQTLKVAFSFTDIIGAAVAFGENNTSSTAAVGLGLFFDLFPARSPQGLAYGLRLRVDYFANTNAFGDGQILFGVGAVFGL